MKLPGFTAQPPSFFTAVTVASTIGLVTGAATDKVYDAIIVGGGLSGLSTAKTLAAAGKTFVILEARNRTGGRVRNVELPNGGYTEVGAEFVGPTQDRVLALAKELDLTLYDTYNQGNNIFYHEGQRSLYDAKGSVPPADVLSLIQLLTVQNDLDNMAKQINIQAPWNSPKAQEWDQLSFGDWLDRRLLLPDAKSIMTAATTSLLSVEPAETSLLYLVSYIAAAGNETTPGTFERLIR